MKGTVTKLADEQIVELRNELLRDGDFPAARICDDALSATLAKYDPESYRKARAQCTKLLAARGR